MTATDSTHGFGGNEPVPTHLRDDQGESWYMVAFRSLDSVMAPARAQARLIALIGLGMTLLTGLVALAIGRGISAPVTRLVDSADRIGRGDLDTTITLNSTDELGQLAQALNRMAASLKQTLISRDRLAQEIEQRKLAEQDKEALIFELTQALAEVKQLSGLLPICANCKKIRDDQGYWHQVENYVRERSEAEFTHGVCPDCARKLYPEFYKEK